MLLWVGSSWRWWHSGSSSNESGEKHNTRPTDVDDAGKAELSNGICWTDRNLNHMLHTSPKVPNIFFMHVVRTYAVVAVHNSSETHWSASKMRESALCMDRFRQWAIRGARVTWLRLGWDHLEFYCFFSFLDRNQLTRSILDFTDKDRLQWRKKGRGTRGKMDRCLI